jgi:hypothetical protein
VAEIKEIPPAARKSSTLSNINRNKGRKGPSIPLHSQTAQHHHYKRTKSQTSTPYSLHGTPIPLFTNLFKEKLGFNSIKILLYF